MKGKESYIIYGNDTNRKPQTWIWWIVELIRRRKQHTFHAKPFFILTVWIILLKTGLLRSFLYFKHLEWLLISQQNKAWFPARHIGKALHRCLPCLSSSLLATLPSRHTSMSQLTMYFLTFVPLFTLFPFPKNDPSPLMSTYDLMTSPLKFQTQPLFHSVPSNPRSFYPIISPYMF